jgi:hypothetical protein
MLILQVSTPAQSSLKVNVRGETKVETLLAHGDGASIMIVGFCGALKENEGVHV